MTEAEARRAAGQRDWRLEKSGKVYRLTDENGTVIAGRWDSPPDYFGLSLADVAEVLEP